MSAPLTTLAMSAALEARLLTLGWEARTAFENVAFEPCPGEAYQRVSFLFARPENRENNRYYLQRGLMQVALCFPAGAGAGPATLRAETIREAFPRGLSLSEGGLTVVIDETPEIGPGFIEADRYVLPLRVRAYAHVTA